MADQWSDYADKYKDRVRSNDRIVTLKRMEGKNSLNSKDNHVYIKVPAGRTKVIQIITGSK